ncbi:MAG: heme-dependent peroxidase [Rubripirellula sp.]|nr:heme-dependent peroxidase [Rubripirellula sp.]
MNVRPPQSGPPSQSGRPQGRPSEPLPDPSVIPLHGWHCTHFFYRFRRDQLDGRLNHDQQQQFVAALNREGEDAPERMASYWISGHRADFGVMLMDPDPAKVDAVHQRLLAAPLGRYIEPAWSFVSMSEVSEYVPSIETFRQRLIDGGTDPSSPELAAKVSAYERRLPMMNEQRLRPEFPEWPAACFYPMNKSRVVGANWFTEPFSRRNALMAEHAQSGIAFAGKVSQLITVGVGVDDWEWMVTLWGRNPDYLKEIVYKMRFDEASAKYAEFGPFYVGYRASAEEILDHCCLG